MSITWHKIWRDLWHNKFRTILVVLSTAVGVFALGLVFGSSALMRERMTESHRASIPPNIEFYTSLFNQDVVDAILQEPGVADAEGEARTSVRWKLEGETEWRDGTVIARAGYEAQRMYRIELMDGDWPDGRVLVVERMSSQYYGLPIGTTIVVEVGRQERRLTIGGVVRHPYTPPPQLSLGNATFCATPETVAWLTNSDEGFSTLNVRLESFSQAGAEEAVTRIKDRLERMGLVVGYYDIVDPETHWAQQMMDGVFLILAVLGVLSLGLSGFLIINTMNAIIAQQVWQVGVMKVVGATFGRIVRIYLTIALAYGLLSLCLAIPLGAIAAYFLSAWMLDLFNVLAGAFRLMPTALVVQVAVGLVTPLLAALVPVVGGARISAHQAISTHGLGGGFGRGWLDRLIGNTRRLPRTTALSLRNTFRRKARVALTLLTLTIGGVMFIMVFSVNASFTHTVEVLLNDFGFDVLAVFDRTYHVSRVVEATESVPGVTHAEVWNIQGATLKLKSGEDLEGQLWAVPDNSQVFHPRIISGRALLPEDDRAILINSKIAADEGIRVGDVVTLTVGARELTWTVVGIVINLNNNQHDNFVPFDTLARETGSANRGAFAMVVSDKHDATSSAQLVRDLRAAYTARRLNAVQFQSAAEVREMNSSQFDILVYLMLAMAILAALVGSIGLMGTMSINVVERGREIGVMRSVGATSRAIAGIFVVEGMLVGVLSWLFAAPLSYPGALAFSNAVGKAVMNLPLDFSYSLDGAVLWLVIVLVLSALASLWPALRATRVSVREALAYE